MILVVIAACMLVGIARPALAQFGVVSFANSGAPAAQPAFLRGLALLHSFQYPDAAAAFKQAQKVDPGFAMAYWGEAMTYNHGVWREQDSVTARAVLARLGATPAERSAKAPTAREKDYLRTLDVLYSGAGTKVGRDSAYANAVAQLSERYPDDVDAQLFHALSLLSLFPRTDSTYLRAASIAAKVMREHPRHPGALHYVIHAYDDPAHARLGLDAARNYSKVAPNAPHAQHMTSHIFIALGMWDDVVAANEVAIRTFQRGRSSAAAPACGHPALWLHYAYLQQGRLADARRMMDACGAASADSPGAAGGYADMRAQYIVDVEQPAHDVAAAPSDAKRPPPMQFTFDVATAYDALRRGDTVNVAALIDRMQSASTATSNSIMAKMMPEGVGAMAVCLDETRALLLLRRGNKDKAVALLRRAAAQEDAIPFMFGPPEMVKPSHELLGETLLSMGRVAEARHEFELALARTPGRSLALLGLARASRAAGDSAAASAAYKQLVANWHRADTVTDAVREARNAAAPMAGARPPLSRDELITISVLPLPEPLRAGAGVVTFDEQRRRVELRKGSNGMICVRLVPGEADWDVRCYHESFIPLFFRRVALRREGLSPEGAEARLNAEIKQAKLVVPARPTAGYRILGPAAAYDTKTGAATTQMMFWQSIHMPFRTATEIGLPNESELSEARQATMPFVMASGTWWSHVMIMHEAPGRDSKP